MTSVVSLSSYEYTAGPWALRLTGQVASLSAVAERVVLRRSRFQLWLWDGAASNETVQGEAGRTDDTGATSRSHPPQFEVAGHGPDLANLTYLVQGYVQGYLDGQEIMPRRGLSQGQMSLTPLGLTRHRLMVVTASRSAEVTMSLLQLADLAAVLAQAEQAIDHWPEDLTLAPQRRTWRRLPLWTGSVAAVLVAAVLGSQWLGPIPSPLVQSPAPTAETMTSGENEVAQGADADPEGTSSTFREDESPLGTDAPAQGNGSAELASPPPPVAAPASPLAASPAGPSPGAAPTPPGPASGAPAAPVAPSSPRAEPPSPPPPSPEEREAAPFSSTPTEAPSPAAEADLSVPNVTEAEVPPPAAARAPSREDRSVPESSPEQGTPALADSASADWSEALRAVLQEIWQPIPGLASPLRYRLSLGPTGEVLAVEPLTAPARQYLTQSRLPQVGAVLPSLQRPTSITVDIELLPSGEVRIDPNDSAPP